MIFRICQNSLGLPLVDSCEGTVDTLPNLPSEVPLFKALPGTNSSLEKSSVKISKKKLATENFQNFKKVLADRARFDREQNAAGNCKLRTIFNTTFVNNNLQAVSTWSNWLWLGVKVLNKSC